MEKQNKAIKPLAVEGAITQEKGPYRLKVKVSNAALEPGEEGTFTQDTCPCVELTRGGQTWTFIGPKFEGQGDEA
jgi:hypothetical protein